MKKIESVVVTYLIKAGNEENIPNRETMGTDGFSHI